MLKHLIITSCITITIVGSANANALKSFFDLFAESKFVCTQYEKQTYQKQVLKPGMHLPWLEMSPKKRVCAHWSSDGKGATGKKCKRYRYINSSKDEMERLYEYKTLERTVCVDGYSTR